MTGLTSEQADRLVLDVYAHTDLDPSRRRAVGPYRSVLLVLLYLRHNLAQALLAELFDCSQSTVSRLISRLTPAVTTALTPNAEHVAARELSSTVRVDGFLAPTGDRRKDTYTSGMYSGKRHRCGFNIQVVGSFHGTLVLTGKPQPGAMHDAKAWRESGLAAKFEGRLHADDGPGGFADTAYTGTGLCVPHRKPKGQSLTESTREYNRAIASRRASVERVIAHLKNWRLLATGYRGLLVGSRCPSIRSPNSRSTELHDRRLNNALSSLTRYDALTGRHVVPSERTFRRVLTGLDGDALDQAVSRYVTDVIRGISPVPVLPARPGRSNVSNAAPRPARSPTRPRPGYCRAPRT